MSKPLFLQSIRNLSLLEYQSRNILKNKGIDIPNYCVIDHKSGLLPFEQFKADSYVVKAQIAAGGRKRGRFENGFQGGVHMTNERPMVEEIVDKMLGYNLITNQTGPEGMSVNKIMISEAVVDVEREAYVSIIADPMYNQPIVMASAVGGVDIETVAEKSPHLIRTIPIDIYDGLNRERALEISKCFGFKNQNVNKITQLLMDLWMIFINHDAIQIEINPLVETAKNKITCLDCKINVDNNAKFRQKSLFEKQEWDDRLESEANKYNLNYVGLDGDIGCMVNGAGLGMATVDLIQNFGGSPANFLDIGGQITIEQATQALNIISSHPKVNVIFINIFGGIVSCKIIAHGIINAMERNLIQVPIIVRLEGSHVLDAKTILKNHNIDLTYADNIEEGVKIAVAMSKSGEII